MCIIHSSLLQVVMNGLHQMNLIGFYDGQTNPAGGIVKLNTEGILIILRDIFIVKVK